MRGLSLLRVFIAVVEAGSFTAAAERLAMTKSAVSQGVAALERELGVQLLQRSTRRLAITQAGQVFERARTRQGALSGLLRITSAEVGVRR